MDEKEPFLSRWSRRKLETRQDAPAAGAKPVDTPGVAAAAMPAPEMPGRATPEYREFFDPKVDEALRRAALKNLFSDPQFNVMDGLDTYVDDYSKPDPIPAAMLRQLNQAKDLFLFDDEKKADAVDNDGAGAAGEPVPAAVPAGVEGPADAAAAGVSDQARGAPTGVVAAPVAADGRKD